MKTIDQAEAFVRSVRASIDAVDKEVSEAIRSRDFAYATYLIDALELALILEQDPEPKHQ